MSDATDTSTWSKPWIIIHVCNDAGKWGAGFTGALSRRWKEPERNFRMFRHLPLGSVQVIPVEQGGFVANMVAQIKPSAVPPLRYDALAECLGRVGEWATLTKASVHMPRIGCGLARGRWELVEPLIHAGLTGLEVVVHDWPRP